MRPRLAAPIAEPTLAPFALVRVAGMPHDAVAGLTPPSVRALIDRAVAAAAAMAAVRGPAEDALFRVAATDDRALRRAALELKRDVHNGRAVRAPDVDALAAGLDDVAAAALRRWVAASAARATAAAALDDELERGVRAHLRPRLVAAGRAPELLRALALASPELTRALLRPESAPQQLASTKRERSVLAYLIRAAAKTSPFSGFLATGVLRLTEGAAEPWLRNGERASRAYVNRGVVAALAAELARTGVASPPLVVSRDARWHDDGAVDSLATTWLEIARRRWRLGAPRRTRLHPALARHLRGREDAIAADVRQAALVAAGLDEPAARALLGQLVDAGVLVCAPVLDAFVERPAAALAASLPESPTGVAVAAALAELEAAASALPAADAAARLELVDRASASCAAAWRLASDRRAPPCINPLLEDGVHARVVDVPAAALAAIGEDLVGALAAHVVERGDHVRLRAAFLAGFGAGGTCHDVAAFLASLGAAPPSAPRAAPPRRAAAPVAVLAQVARDDDGDLIAVVNQMHTGGGPMLARWAIGDDAAAAALRDELRAWIARIAAGALSLDVPVCGDGNPLQAHPRLTDALLALPGEPCAAPGALDLRALSLVHDRASDALLLRGPAGEPLHPVYLGATVLTEASGPAYWLGVLARPYEVQRPAADVAAPVVADDVDVVHRSRRTHGRVVLQRASTWIRADRLRARWFRRAGGARLLDVADDLAALGIGDRFFARRPLERRGDDADDAKPLWVDSRNPFCLDLLERFVDGAAWIACVELLPDPSRAWPPSQDGPHVTELLLEVLL